MSLGCDMRKPSQIVPIDTVKRKIIKHKALSSPEEEVSQSLHCRSHPNRIDFFLSPLRLSRKVPSGKPSIHKSSSISSDQYSETRQRVKSGSRKSEQD